MPDLPTPDADLVAGLRSLRPTISAWLARDLSGPAHDYTRAYTDLMLAFGLARLGAAADANQLVRDAEAVLTADEAFGLQPPDDRLARQDRWLTSRVCSLLYRMFRFRVEETLRGETAAHTLPAELLPPTGERAPPASPIRLVEYVTSAIRARSRILEPHPWVNVYEQWTRAQDTSLQLLDLSAAVQSPGELERRIDGIVTDAARENGESLARIWWRLLPFVGMTSEGYRTRTLLLLPAVVDGLLESRGRTSGHAAEWLHWAVVGTLSLTLRLAAGLSAGKHVPPITDVVLRTIGTSSEIASTATRVSRSKVVAELGWSCLCWFRQLGDREAANTFLHESREFWPRMAADSDFHCARANAILCGFQSFLRQDSEAAARLDAVTQLLTSACRRERNRWCSADVAEVAMALLRVASLEPPTQAIERARDVLATMPRLTNTWTTAQQFSRSHLQVIESLVLAFPAVRGV